MPLLISDIPSFPKLSNSYHNYLLMRIKEIENSLTQGEKEFKVTTTILAEKTATYKAKTEKEALALAEEEYNKVTFTLFDDGYELKRGIRI